MTGTLCYNWLNKFMEVIAYVEKNKSYFEHNNRVIHWRFYRTRNICTLGLQETSRFICYAVCSVVHKHSGLWLIYDCCFDSGHHNKADYSA